MQRYKNINNKLGKIVSNKSQGVTESRRRATRRLYTQDLNEVRVKVRIYKARRNNCGKEGKSCTSQLIFIMWSQHGDFLINQGPDDNKKGFISHLRDCQSSSLWLLSEGRLVRGEQSQCTSAAARWPPCALQPRRCCQVEAPCQTLHREELFLKPSSRCATGGDLGAVLGWGSLHQTGRLWGTNADLKINKQIRGAYIRVPNFQKTRQAWTCFSTELQTFEGEWGVNAHMAKWPKYEKMKEQAKWSNHSWGNVTLQKMRWKVHVKSDREATHS